MNAQHNEAKDDDDCAEEEDCEDEVDEEEEEAAAKKTSTHSSSFLGTPFETHCNVVAAVWLHRFRTAFLHEIYTCAPQFTSFAQSMVAVVCCLFFCLSVFPFAHLLRSYFYCCCGCVSSSQKLNEMFFFPIWRTPCTLTQPDGNIKTHGVKMSSAYSFAYNWGCAGVCVLVLLHTTALENGISDCTHTPANISRHGPTGRILDKARNSVPNG